MSSNVIALDGPAASGKSSVSKLLSERLGIACVNTGSFYRALGWKLLRSGKHAEEYDDTSIRPVLEKTIIAYERPAPEKVPEIRIDGVFPGAELFEAEVSKAASKVATFPAVRAWLLELQRSLAGKEYIVMEGRDIGSVVFPDARVKFFLTASPLVRAKRRLLQSGKPFDDAALQKVAEEIAARDEQDRNRAAAPLVQTADAILVDNSGMTLEETLDFMLAEIRKAKRTVLRYRVPYADTDQMGVVYYANYLKYFEMFRSEMMLENGISYRVMEEDGWALPVIEANCCYKSSAHYEDMIEIIGRITECKGVRLKIECRVLCNGKLLAEGYTVHACVDIKTKRPCRVPALFYTFLEKGSWENPL